MEDMLRVGVITSTHGLAGEVKVFPTTDDPQRFRFLKEVYADTKKGLRCLHVDHVRFFKQFVIVHFDGLERIEDVQDMLKCDLLVTRENAIPLEEGEYYLADVLGSTVVDEEGKKLGTLEDYLETAAQIVYKIRTEAGKEVLIPAVDEFIREVNVEEKRMVIHVIPGRF